MKKHPGKADSLPLAAGLFSKISSTRFPAAKVLFRVLPRAAREHHYSATFPAMYLLLSLTVPINRLLIIISTKLLYPSATSSASISVNPKLKQTVPRLECFP